MPMWWDGGGWAAWIVMLVVMLVILAIVVWAVAGMTRDRGDRPRGVRTAEDILSERYAAGEIDDEEYERRRERLRRR